MNARSCLVLPLLLFSCASPSILGDPWRDSPKAEVSQKEFSTFDFHAFPSGPVCEGSKARSKLTYTTTVTPPTYRNIPPSIAAARNVELFLAVQDYLQNDFLYNASSPELQGQNFKKCTDYRVYTGQSGAKGECWIEASNNSRDVLNKNVPFLTHILLAHATDLAVYRQNFAFMTAGNTDKADQWRAFLSKAQLEEADQEDGSVKYTISLDMDSFCKFGTATSDLVSK